MAPVLPGAHSPVALPDEHLLPLFKTVVWFPEPSFLSRLLRLLGVW